MHSLTESERELLLAGWKGSQTLDSATGDRPVSREREVQRTDAVIQGLMEVFAPQLRDALREFMGRELKIEPLPAGRPVGGETLAAARELRGTLEPLDEPICLKFESGFLDPLLERLLGGGMHVKPERRRVLTPIEFRLTQRLGAVAAGALTRCLQGSSGVPLSVSEMHLPADQSEVLASEEWCWGGVLIEGGGCGGRMIWGLSPQAAEALFPQRESLSRRVIGAEHEAGRRELAVVLAELELSDDEVDGLSIGDVVVTGRGTEEPLTVLIDGIAVFEGKAGTWSGRKAVRLSAATPPERGGAVDSEASPQ